MEVEIDHVFILCDPGAPQASLLTEAGLVEGPGNRHPGQGSANRRFFFANAMLELLYLDDVDTAAREPARRLRLKDRWLDPAASPFGLVLRRIDPDAPPPFPGWRYYPEYFDDSSFFIVGENSDVLAEPLCICLPQQMPGGRRGARPQNPGLDLTGLRLGLPVERLSQVLSRLTLCPGFELEPGREHRLELCFNRGAEDLETDFRPRLPLVIRR